MVITSTSTRQYDRVVYITYNNNNVILHFPQRKFRKISTILECIGVYCYNNRPVYNNIYYYMYLVSIVACR